MLESEMELSRRMSNHIQKFAECVKTVEEFDNSESIQKFFDSYEDGEDMKIVAKEMLMRQAAYEIAHFITFFEKIKEFVSEE